MKKLFTAVILLIMIIVTGMACTRSADEPIPNSLLGRWTFTDKQAPGTGPPGVWSVASPAGQWMELSSGGQVSGTVFPNATRYQVLDSVTVKLTDPSDAAGFRLFNYQVDTVERALYFYIRLSNGGSCFEGCGTYKFKR